ncbi:MAG: carboxymuconolactone decarboxylase family protein, partial [Thermodesulfobacteriota bacterium]
SAHTAAGKMFGFTDEQIIEIRQGSASFDSKLDALAKFASSLVTNRGNASQETKNAFFEAGYNEANMIDVVMVIGDMAITNSIHQLAGFEIDFPLAPELNHEVD